jgi:hypothetical protein
MQRRALTSTYAFLLLCAPFFLPGSAEAEDSAAMAARRINPGTVNNVAADTTAQNTQSTGALVDLGGGRLVSFFGDSGSFDGTVGGNNDHLLGYATSTNNGVTWTDRGRLANNAIGDVAGGWLAHNTLNGQVYLGTTGFQSRQMSLYRSGNGGQTFGAPINVTPGYNNTDFIGGASIAVDNFPGTGRGKIYACWGRFAPAAGIREVRLTRSANNGVTWGPNLGTLISNGGGQCSVVVGPDHAVYAFYLRGTNPQGSGGDNKIYMRRSINGGVSFQPERVVADMVNPFANGQIFLAGDAFGASISSTPQPAVNPVNGRGYLYVVYSDDTGGDNFENGNIMMVRSVNGGTTWSAPVRINDDVAGDQFIPSIGFTPDGEKFIVSYYTRSDDVGGSMFHRRGRLGTLNAQGVPVFNQSFRVGPNTPFLPYQDPVVGGSLMTYLGSFYQTAGSIGRLSIVWADNRLGTAVHERQTDIRFAQIAVPAPASNVALAVTANPTTINLGRGTTITMTVSATGGEARDVVLSFKPVTGLLFRSIQSPGGPCDVIEGFGGCVLGTIPAGTSKVVRVVYAGVYQEATRAFQASVTASGRDTVLANNAAARNIVVNRGPAVVHTLSTGNIAVAFDENTPREFPFNVAGGGKVAQVTAEVRLTHDHATDVEIELEAPNGERVLLAPNNGSSNGGGYGSGANSCAGTRTVFNDLAATSIFEAESPFTGSFKPLEPLVDTFMQNAAGTWKVHVRDRDFGDGGVIGCVRLLVTRAP